MERWKWLIPGMRVKRWLFLVFVGVALIAVGIALLLNTGLLGQVEAGLMRLLQGISPTWDWLSGLLLVLLGIFSLGVGMRGLIHSITGALVPGGDKGLAESVYRRRGLAKGPKIVVVGGGTGLSTMLRGLKTYSENITAVVTVADDGGSSGRIRDELGILPPGDVRNTLVSLADTEPLMERLFQYRFSWGEGLHGHSFGNLFIAAMTDITGDFEEAIREMSKVLAVRGRVLPATLETVRLRARYRDGEEVVGESRIPQEGRGIARISLEPEDASALPEALEAVREADIVILGPGSLYTSVIPNLLVHPIPQALADSEALKVYVCNVMTQPGETEEMTASGHVQALLDHASGHPIVDCCLVNDQRISKEQAESYAQQGAYAIEPDAEKLRSLGLRVETAPLLDAQDLVRHDPDKLARAIMDIMESTTGMQWWHRAGGTGEGT